MTLERQNCFLRALRLAGTTLAANTLAAEQLRNHREKQAGRSSRPALSIIASINATSLHPCQLVARSRDFRIRAPFVVALSLAR